MCFRGCGIVRTAVGLGGDVVGTDSWGEGGGMKMEMGRIRADGCVGLVDGCDCRSREFRAMCEELRLSQKSHMST